MKKLLFILSIFLPLISLAQTSTLRGIVKDEAGQVITKAKVKIQGTSVETFTDSIGAYELKNVPFGKTVVEVSGSNNLLFTQNVDVNSQNVILNINTPTVNAENVNASNTEIPTVSLNDEEMSESSSSRVSSLLTAARDPFYSATTFTFSIARFRFRGYDSDYSPTLLNGALITDLSNGRSEYYVYGGLNNAVRSRENLFGIKAGNFSFGGIGGVTSIDSRASHLRKQLEVSYASSNRTYNNRLVVSFGSGTNSKGWAYAVSYARRWADEGYVPGTFYDGHSFYGSVEKKIGLNNSLSLTSFAVSTKSGRPSPSVQEIKDLAGSNYYNPNWGYQNGKKRNARVANSFQPTTIFTHDWNINEKSSLKTALSYKFGKYKSSGLDWYKAEDPRPDYYRYLPSFDPSYGKDPLSEVRDSLLLANYLSENESARQIDWEKIYNANQTHELALYVLSNSVTDAKSFGFNTTYNNNLTDNLTLSSGFAFQKQDLHYYKELVDLLGGKSFVNLNQFSDITTLVDPNVIQLDLNNPNATVKEGDKYAYDYLAHLHQSTVWVQSMFKYERFDFFLAAQLALSGFYRTGNFKNGVFPENSFGDSKKYNFTNPSFKGGVTYKYNGRNYFYVNGALVKRAPLFDNTFIAPRTNSNVVGKPVNESISTIEGGYLYNSPRLKGRATGYLTNFSDITKIRRFYYDDLKTFVNYTVNGIEKRHTGIELAVDANLGKGFTASAVASLGEFLYTNRPSTTITQDNKDTLLANGDLVYIKNLRVSGGPQKAYTFGINYRSKKFWNIFVNLNYFDDIYADINPARRTLSALEFVNEGTPTWESILGQEKRDGQFTMDVSGGWSWKINNKFKALKQNSFVLFNIGITNILNNKELTNTAFEQLRFDNKTHNISTFPNKYSYAFGATYFASITLRFN